MLLMVEEKDMEVKITDLHPTQLYLSEKKLHDIQMLDQSADIINVDPISVLAFGNRFLITDGITGLIRLIGRSGYDFS